MANGFGFIPCADVTSSGYTGRLRRMVVPSGDGTAIYMYDLVKIAATPATDATDLDLCNVTRGATGTTDTPYGIVVGMDSDPNDLKTRYRKASTKRVLLVWVDPYGEFYVSENGSPSVLASSSYEQNVAFTTTAGSTVTGVSGMQIDSNSAATTPGLPIRLLQLETNVGNIVSQKVGGGSTPTNPVWRCRWNIHQLAVTNTTGHS